ncbi:hypothetical protein JCM19238_4898 [Vibrio ponticus]|nr:hypothetical protein JCM19238_4898 [Vibrio ponticus]
MSRLNTQLAKIKADIRQQIAAGELLQGQKLLGERALSEQFGTTRITLKDALIALETEADLSRRATVGMFLHRESVTTLSHVITFSK